MGDGNAATITKASKSNLAFSFIALPKEKREDITVFYAFCRVIDDIADDPGFSETERHDLLNQWRRALTESFPGEPELAEGIRIIRKKYGIPATLFEEIIAGVEMDLKTVRYETFEALKLYCYRVASAVGLVSIEIFGYKNPACREYAMDLGMALQLTNILRDVQNDFANGERIYLPQEDLERFNYTENDLREKKHDERFVALMEFEAKRAWDYYRQARTKLPMEDRGQMVAAEIMRTIYSTLLSRMQKDAFQVFAKRYRLGKWTKIKLAISTYWKTRLNILV